MYVVGMRVCVCGACVCVEGGVCLCVWWCGRYVWRGCPVFSRSPGYLEHWGKEGAGEHVEASYLSSTALRCFLPLWTFFFSFPSAREEFKADSCGHLKVQRLSCGPWSC